MMTPFPKVAAKPSPRRHGTAVLSAEEELELINRWIATGDRKAADLLATRHQRLVIAIASQFTGYGLPIAELVAEGNVGLMRAMNRFEPERGLRFATYAAWWVRASVLEFVLKNWTPLTVSLSTEHKRLFFKLRAAKNKLGPDPYASMEPALRDIIAAELKVKPETVEEMDRLMSNPMKSLSDPVAADSPTSFQDLLPCDRPNPEMIVAEAQEKKQRRALLKEAWKGLTERERGIIAGRRLRDKPAKLEELGRLYGISAERVRQIENAAVGKLKDLMLRAAGAMRPAKKVEQIG